MSERPAVKKIMLGLPGTHFTNNFLTSWTSTVVALLQSGKYDIHVHEGVSSFVPFARMKTLGLNVLRGQEQKAFGGQDYDYFVTLDSDIVYQPKQFEMLLEGLETHPVVAGIYMMADNQNFAVVKQWDTKFFAENGYFQFLGRDEVEKYTKAKKNANKPYIKVDYTGLGFFACRKEVLDALEYPYFWGELQVIEKEDGTILKDQMSEDVAFCRGITAAGYDIHIDTRLRVGHEKMIIL